MKTATKSLSLFCAELVLNIFIDGTSLVIHDLTGKDDGEYTCELETKVLVISLVSSQHIHYA